MGIVTAILVTGGVGFIGSSLVERLLKRGNKVVVVDSFDNYYCPKIKENNLLEIKKNIKDSKLNSNNFKLYRQDIRDEQAIEQIFLENKIEIIIHLAAMAGVRYSISMPKLYYDVNVMGTLNILENARKFGINKIIFGSSSSVYGENKKVPFSEKDNCIHQISPYATTKKIGELMCYIYHSLYHINFLCLRFFTVYGPRQRPDLAIYKFTRLILENKPIPIFGDGSSERDYTYIDDVVDGILKALQYLQQKDKIFEIINLGNSKTISLLNMVNIIEIILNKKAVLEKQPMQQGDVVRTYADISKAKELLGYFPQKDFMDGVKEFVEWFKKQRGF